MIATTNPATGRVEKTFDALTSQQIDERLQRADDAASAIRNSTYEERADWLLRAASILREEQDALAQLMTMEMGKTISAARSEVEKCAWVCEFYANEGRNFLADRAIITSAKRSFARYLPLGPVLAVMPWNFPLWQVFRFAAPAIMAGNVGLLKHASNVPQSALAIEDIWRRSCAQKNVFQTLLISGSQVEAVVKDERVKAATVTGSEGAGRAVAESAGTTIKKVVLELGGSDPFIVMPSADLDEAVKHAALGRLMNNGQSCIAAKRFIVHADVYDSFRDRLVAEFEKKVVGDPTQDSTDVGPLATEEIRETLDDQVNRTIEKGGVSTFGAKIMDGDGWYYQPGILENVPADSPAAKEELFGPVATLFKVDHFDDAIKLANDSRFGLGSAIFTREETEMEAAFDQLEAGSTFVNTITASDPRLPFGGIKASGIGRELSEDGIREFTNLKTCCVGASS